MQYVKMRWVEDLLGDVERVGGTILQFINFGWARMMNHWILPLLVLDKTLWGMPLGMEQLVLAPRIDE